MADSYEVVSIVPTIENAGGGKTTEGVIYTARAKPSGVQFSLFIANVDLVPSRLRLIVPVVAGFVNNAAQVEGVGYLNVYLDVNQSGQFAHVVDTTVTSTSGNSEQDIHPPYGSLADDTFAGIVARTRANLDAIEGE